MFKARIKTDGAAFRPGDTPDAGPEVARILREIADRVEGGERDGTPVDYNGNVVGEWSLR